MEMEQKRNFLINVAYWLVVAAAAWLGMKYLLPVAIPLLLGIGVAWLAVRITQKFHSTNKLLRIGLSLLIYGILGLLVALAVVESVSAVSGLAQWMPRFYEKKLHPLVVLAYQWSAQQIRQLDPTLLSALQMVTDNLLSGLKNVISYLSGAAVDLISGLAAGIPNLILSLLTMIFTTLFLVGDYEKAADFVDTHIPAGIRKLLTNIRIYLTDTLFVVIRSYMLIMLLTFTELSILFTLFGIENSVMKAAVIAMLDILPVLGTGGIMVPWAVTSLVLGYTRLGLELLLIYGIVTVVRNYVEPKVVGTQLGLHPLITLSAMFVGLRLLGFWGLFGLPVGISFLWKQKTEGKSL